ncbi:hypothetical protein B0H65DRAFT_480693 [Neurospora tetraspora]|uniref:Uncharacterized protein n=1 Tax=Neurospora tetraspora TaxID=94610 RepID=A0AAE0J168_9PEZI|nr:hypothetical protein B0H65DRAFT_480693 [Neurospora tetraspora]
MGLALRVAAISVLTSSGRSTYDCISSEQSEAWDDACLYPAFVVFVLVLESGPSVREMHFPISSVKQKLLVQHRNRSVVPPGL